MRRRCALLLLIAATVAVPMLTVFALLVPSIRVAQAAQLRPISCISQLSSRLRITEAWTWTLCFDNRESCELVIVAQRPIQVVHGLIACTV